MKNFIKKKLNENLVFELIDNMVDEEYPQSFNIEEFKTLRSFNKRIQYCQEHLKRISSGSSRIVYMVDNEKVLKLAKNNKGLAQNEIEIEYGGYYDISDIVAKIFDYDENNLWVEMELARKVTKPIFKMVTGYSFEDYSKAIYNYGIDSGNGRGSKYDIDKNIVEDMWENEFTYGIFSFIGDYGLPTGDFLRLSSYGLVKRDGKDTIVMIDYGLNNDVYQSYYS